MAVKDLIKGYDPERLSNAYTDVRREQIAEAISESTEDFTQVEVINIIRGLEDDVIEEFNKDKEQVPDYVLRAMAQSVILDKLVEKMENGK